MSDRLHELDQSHALLAALTSFWWRLPILFLCFWLGHYVGLNAADGGPFLSELWQKGPVAAVEMSQLNPVYVPLTWFWSVVVGCEHPIGALYLFLIGAAFLIVRLSEDRYVYGFAIGVLAQPIHTFLVEARGNPFENSDPFDIVVAFVVLLTWEVMIGFLCWRYLRPTR